jgi:hypothetical protein
MNMKQRLIVRLGYDEIAHLQRDYIVTAADAEEAESLAISCHWDEE